MKNIVLLSLISGTIMFVLFMVSDMIFFSSHSIPRGLKQFKNKGYQLLVFYGLTIIHTGIIVLFYVLFLNGFKTSTILKGMIFGFFCGLVLARPNVEGLLLFKSEFVPKQYTAYWLAEYIIGYSILGTLISIYHKVLMK